MELETRRPVAELEAAYGAQALAAELAHEDRMVNEGAEKVRKQVQQAREQGHEGNTRYGQALVAKSVEGMAKRIGAFVESANAVNPETGRKKAGVRHVAVKYLEQVDHEVAGFITMRVIIDGLLGRNQTMQRIAVDIGKRIEDEVRFAAFADFDKKRYDRALEKAKKGTIYGRKSATMAGHERRYGDGEWTSWPEVDRLHLGMKLISLAKETGWIVDGRKVKTQRDTDVVIEPTQQLVDWIESETEKSALLSPALQPMVVQPLDWTTPFDGGYLTKRAQGKNALVKTGNHNYLTEMYEMRGQMPAVYAAVNALQSTRWQINQKTYSTAQAIWQEREATEVFPPRENIPTVQCPGCGQHIKLPETNTRGSIDHACFEDEEILRQWKKDAYETHEKNVALRSKRMVTIRTLDTARRFSECEAIYFPHQLDFRGRVYAIPSFNPQGADLTKGLIHFADGMPIKDGVAAGWLAIQGANVWGYDKASLEDRIAWVEGNEEMILRCAEDPLQHREWMQADGGDSAWQFLAFCFEWKGFCDEGYGFVSHLPVALDGSCSGIQHFSAMLLDEVGAEAVNVTPQETPADIYKRVCDKTVEKLEVIAGQGIGDTIAIVTAMAGLPRREENEEGESNSYGSYRDEATAKAAYAMGWLLLQPNRKTTKRQVMTLPYGSTMFSCREYTEVWLDEQIEAGVELPWDKADKFKATQFMASLIWESINEVVVAARDAMTWLQHCAKLVSKEGVPFNWQTPSGFIVSQEYKNFDAKRVKTKLGEQVIKLTLREEKPEFDKDGKPQNNIDKRGMSNGISPNYVHSMDATHLVMSTDLGTANGIDHFAMIHDSYGTHAAQTNKLAACLREAFVNLYEGRDVLGDFREEVLRQVGDNDVDKVKPVPAKGNLDVATVRDSDFFFA